MFRSPLGRKLVVRARAARRFALVLSLFVVAACVPFIKAGAWQQEEAQPRKSQVAAKGQASVIEGAEFVPGEVLVRFRSDAAAKTAEAAPMSLRSAGDDGDVTFQRFEGSDIVLGLRLAKVDAARTLEAVNELAARPDVLYAEPNYIWRAKRTPNDPRFPEMYGMNRIGAPAAWNTTIGSRSVVVGVLDGGVDINHEDLRDNIWKNPGEVANNNFDDDGNGFIDDVSGWDFHHNDKTIFDGEDGDDHATHVAGTIGAEGDNAIGVTGVNWEVSIMSLKVLGPSGGNTSNIIRGYNYALQMRQRGVNLRVLNNSYGGPGKSLAALDAIRQLNAAGILFVVAAGNGGGDSIGDDNFSFPDFPSNYDSPNVIAVASTNSGDALSSFSNYGARVVSIGAPGSSILSTVPPSMASVLGFPAGTAYAFYGGTSMASPHVAGAAGLILAANPNLTLSQLRGALAFTGDRIPSLDGKTTTGRRLNVANAVASALENDTTPPATPANFRVVAQSGRSVTLGWNAPGDDNNAGTPASDYDIFFINPTTQAKTLLPTSLIPALAGTPQTIAVDVPFRNFSGTIQLHTYDNAGNSSVASVNVNVPVNSGSDPYIVTLSAAQPLTTGTATNLFPNGGDDKYASYTLPANFSFPFYGVGRKNITVSSNGVLYFSAPPRRENGDADDAGSDPEGLQGQSMIAGLWDDIDLNRTSRPDSGVYVTQLDANRIVFRWQGIPCNPTQASGGACTGGSPINFEIELRTDGTIQMRYGQNPTLFPVVGISGGEPDAYIVSSHTSETANAKNLSNAQTVTFSPRATGHLVSGRVTENNVGLGGVTITLSGSLSATTTTDSNGNYSFANLPAGGDYGFTPSKQGYTFSPPNVSIFNLAADNATINFTAQAHSAGPNVVGFAQVSYQYGEGDGRATFTVTRVGDTSGAATLDYRTTDSDTFQVGCADTVNNAGGAFARCDFATTVGKLSFAAGEVSKTITVPLIDDGHDEGTETFQLQLSNPTGSGTSLGGLNVATVTLLDNDTGVVPNPVTNSISFFVRQQYLDFLSREPEPSEPWSAVLTRCANINTGPATNTDCDRIAVSRAFYESPEFNVKGLYVFRFYKLAFNRLPQYTEIVSDMSFVAGATAEEVFARKAQLATAFTERQEFFNAYGSLSNAQFVSALLGRYALASISTPDPFAPDSGTKVTLTNAELTNRLDTALLTRAQVFRAIADSDQVSAAEFNSAFVAMQYYGYLRRTPEPAGYDANLNALQRGTSRREMINGFLNSAEYRLRFGQP
jgi:subtilisin family serine protease